MKRQITTTALTAVFITASVTAGLTGSVTAAGDDGMFTFDGESDDGLVPDWINTDAIKYSVERTAYGLGFGADDTTSADTHAQNAEEALLANEQAFLDYANNQVPNTTDKTTYDSFKVCFNTNDGTAVRYLESPVTSGNYTDLTVDQTANQTVDKTVTFSGYSATVADDIVTHVNTKYASQNRAPDGQLKGYLGGQLGSSFLTESVTDGDASC